MHLLSFIFLLILKPVCFLHPLFKQMKHVKDRFGDSMPEEVLLLCLGITSGIGRLVFGRVADYVPGAKKVYLQVCLHAALEEYTDSVLKALVAGPVK